MKLRIKKPFYVCSGNGLKGFLILFMLIYNLAQATPPLIAGKDINKHPPRVIRTCCTFGIDLSYGGIPFLKRTDIISLDKLGSHRYLSHKGEGIGIIYTRKGGFIDMGHLRDCADWTAYMYAYIKYTKENGIMKPLKLGVEGGEKELVIIHPDQIDSINIFELAGKIAYELSLWHEISTWFGASYVPLLPERYSSFSPEDLFSNLLGVRLGIEALKSPLNYDSAMTQILRHTLDTLGAVATADETYDAMEKTEELWWTKRKSLPSRKILLKRNFSNELFLIPWLIPDDTYAEAPAKLFRPYEGLSNIYELRIYLNYHFPLHALFNHSYKKYITQNEFKLMVNYIENEVRIEDLKLKSKKKQQKRLSN